MLQKQIKNAEYSLTRWPEWMKVCGHFAGSQNKDSAAGEAQAAKSGCFECNLEEYPIRVYQAPKTYDDGVKWVYQCIEHALPGWLVERAKKSGHIAAVSYLKQCLNNAEVENERLRKELAEARADKKRHAVAFYYWWHNQPGVNTESGYDEWLTKQEPTHDKD